jgi:hypothetical protein
MNPSNTPGSSAPSPIDAFNEASPASAATVAPTISEPLYISIGPESWSQAVMVLMALVQDGTPEGRRMAIDQVRSMARAADLAAGSVALLNRLLSEDLIREPAAVGEAERLLEAAGIRRTSPQRSTA